MEYELPGINQGQINNEKAGFTFAKGLRAVFLRDPDVIMVECRGTGFSGRVAIYEMVRMTPELRELVLARAPEAALLIVAKRDRTSTLREQCIARVREGITTLEEVVRVTQ